MKKIYLLILSLFILCGCQTTKEVELEQPMTLSFFYIETCSECNAFKENAIPYLEERFKDQLIINLYDLDNTLTQPIYDQVIDQLKDWDEEFYGNGPFIVVDGYFTVLGYTTGDEEYLASDIQKASENKELGDELEGLRFYYQ